MKPQSSNTTRYQFYPLGNVEFDPIISEAQIKMCTERKTFTVRDLVRVAYMLLIVDSNYFFELLSKYRSRKDQTTS